MLMGNLLPIDPPMSDTTAVPAEQLQISAEHPIICPRLRVIEDWIDYNGHLNMAFYNVIFDKGVDYLFDYLGVGADYAKSGVGSCFTMQAHVNYLQELSLHDEVSVTMQILDYDHKRIHYFEQMHHATEGYLAATSEQLCMHIDMTTRRSASFPQAVQDKLQALMACHEQIDKPAQVGRSIGIRRS